MYFLIFYFLLRHSVYLKVDIERALEINDFVLLWFKMIPFILGILLAMTIYSFKNTSIWVSILIIIALLSIVFLNVPVWANTLYADFILKIYLASCLIGLIYLKKIVKY